MSRMRRSLARGNAYQCMRLFLRVQRLSQAVEAAPGPLLRVLLFRECEMPARANGQKMLPVAISVGVMPSNNALERTGQKRGPRLAAAKASCPAAQLSR